MQQKYNKILIFAQFWTGDMEQMQELLRLIADLEQDKCPYADFVYYPRVDTRQRDFRGLEALKTKFNVEIGRSKRSRAGWPFGPNAVAMDVFRDAHKMWMDCKFPYDAAMLMEADCVPLRKGWIRELVDEWNANNGKFLGFWHGSGWGPLPSHMNGNLLFHPSVIEYLPTMAHGEVPQFGWDMAFWPDMRQYARPSRLIWSDYQLNTPKNPLDDCEDLWKERIHTHPENPLLNEVLNPCYLHGTKGMKAINCVRAKLLC
jgi:hypothetical protein